MKVLHNFMAILILGISGSAIAQEGLPSSDEPNPAGNVKIMTPEECKKTGGSAAYRTWPDEWENFVNCSIYASPRQFEIDMAATTSNGQWDAMVKSYCVKLPLFVQCASSLVDPIKPCLDSVGLENIANIRNITSSLVEYLCQNDGSRVTSFFTNGGIPCTETNQRAQRTCPLDASSIYRRRSNQPIWVELGLIECVEIENFANCNVAALRTCENPTPADVLQYIMDFYKTRKSCSSNPATTASPAA